MLKFIFLIFYLETNQDRSVKPGHKDKLLLKEYFYSILAAIAKFFPQEESSQYIQSSKNIPEFLKIIIQKLKEKEATGWDGSDLAEEQLNVLTLISNVFLQRNRSKYKTIETPSEIIQWYLSWIETVFKEKDLEWKN